MRFFYNIHNLIVIVAIMSLVVMIRQKHKGNAGP